MAFNPMQQQQSPDMLMAMMTDPRATPQQRMAAMSALNTMRGGANAPQPPQMTGDGTGVSDMDPAFMAAVRQEMMGQGPEEQPEIAQRQAAPEAPQNPSTEALMSGAADASRVAAMAQGGAVRHYLNGTDGNDPSSYSPRNAAMGMINFAKSTNLENLSLPELVNIIEDPTTEPSVRARAISKATISRQGGQTAAPAAAPSDRITDWVNEHQKEAKAYVDEQGKIIDDPNRSFASKALAGAEAGGTQLFDVYGAGAFGKLFGNPSQVSISGDEVGAVAAPKTAAPGRVAPKQVVPKPVAPVKVAPGPVAQGQVAPGGEVVAPVVEAGADIDSVAYENALAEIQKNRPETSLDTLKKMVRDRGSDKLSSQDKNMALLQASLGTMAAASQPGAKFLGSIGQGGLVGLEGLEKAKALRAKEKAFELETYATLAALEEKNKPELTEFQKSMDAQAGKDTAEYIARGGPATTARNLKQLTEVEGILKDAIESGEGITGSIAGTLSKIPIIGPRFFEKTIKTREMVEQVVQSDLRTILGGQFASKEGEGVLKRGYNEDLSEEENLRRVQLLISTMNSASRAKEAQTRHVMKFGTLRGYEGPSVDTYLLELEQKFDVQDKAARDAKSKKPVSENRSAADKIILGE